MKQVEIIVKGRVQGVGFRYFIQEKAIKLNLKGWIKNEDYDKVCIIAEGSEDSIKELINLSRKGPSLATVFDTDINYLEATEEFSDFTIRY